MEFTEKELQEYFSKLEIPKHIRMFVITPTAYVRIYKGKITWGLQEEEFALVRRLKCERGEILDLFSKLEFWVNELIQLRLLGPNSEKSEMLDEILERSDFFSRIKILEKFGIIDHSLVNALNETRQVRNGFAHSWEIHEVYYKEKPIESNFPLFKGDMEKIWAGLVAVYSKEQKKYDVDRIFEEIREFNRKK